MGIFRKCQILILLFVSLHCFGQIERENISIDSTAQFVTIIGNDFKGAIISKEIEPGFNKKKLAKRFNPTIDEIIKAENGLTENYNSAMKKDSRVNGFKKIKNIRSNFKDYTRQYLGYFNEKGDRIIRIHLASVEKLKKEYGKNEFDWKSSIVTGCGDVFYENMITLVYNLDNEKLGLW